MPAYDLTLERQTFTADYVRAEDYLDVTGGGLQWASSRALTEPWVHQSRGEWLDDQEFAQWQRRASENFSAIRELASPPPAPFRTDFLARSVPTSTRGSWSSYLSARESSGGEGAYSFARRLNQLAALPVSDRPPLASLDIATLLHAYAGARSRVLHVDVPPTVLTYVDGGGLLVEWNVRGRMVQHFECLVSATDRDHCALLHSTEAPDGRILRMTEIPRADLTETLAELARFLQTSIVGSRA